MITLLSTRFNDETWDQNKEYRKKKNISCLYGSVQELSRKITYNSVVFVVEMNNSKNRIEGIGLIRNRPVYDKYYKVYTNGNYNRYIYISNYHIDRETLLIHNKNIVDALDYVLFKEKTHMKRGDGHTTIPEKLLKHEKCKELDIPREIKELFTYIFKEQIQEEKKRDLPNFKKNRDEDLKQYKNNSDIWVTP
jgi:hypothetical protein